MFKKKFAKSIQLFLMDSDPGGRIVCELSNWNGKAYKIPRKKISDCKERAELASTGVYILIGGKEDHSSKPKTYIGETENILKRLTQHLKKDFWTDAIVFFSQGDRLNKGHAKYLEATLYRAVKEAGRYEIENETIPSASSISEADQAEMEEFAECIFLLTTTLGIKVFDPILPQSSSEPEDTGRETLYLRGARGANAQGEQTSDGFVVLKNSDAAANPVASYAGSFEKLRNELIQEGVITQNEDGQFKFSQNQLFSSPSTAAAIVMGRNANGLIEWKSEKGIPLKEIELL